MKGIYLVMCTYVLYEFHDDTSYLRSDEFLSQSVGDCSLMLLLLLHVNDRQYTIQHVVGESVSLSVNEVY